MNKRSQAWAHQWPFFGTIRVRPSQSAVLGHGLHTCSHGMHEFSMLTAHILMSKGE